MGDDEAYQTPMYQPLYQSLAAAGIPVLYDMRRPRLAGTQQVRRRRRNDRVDRQPELVEHRGHLQRRKRDRHRLAAPGRGVYDRVRGDVRPADRLQRRVQTRDNTTHTFDLGGTPVESYFSPTDNVEQAILDELGAATESVYFAMFYLTSDPIGDVLVSKATAGVTVRGIFDAVGATNAYSQDEKLCAAGLPIKVETFRGKVHHKFAVIDVNGADPRVITGSYNWTAAGAETQRREDADHPRRGHGAGAYQEYLRLYGAIPSDAVCSRHSAEVCRAAFGVPDTAEIKTYVTPHTWHVWEFTWEQTT